MFIIFSLCYFNSIPEDIKPVMYYGYQHMMIEKMKHKEAIRREKIREREVILF